MANTQTPQLGRPVRCLVETGPGLWQPGELLLVGNQGRDFHCRIDGETRVDIWSEDRVRIGGRS